MKPWRKKVIGLLLVTVTLSLWAGVPAPADCVNDTAGEHGVTHNGDKLTAQESSGHDHHAMFVTELPASDSRSPQHGLASDCNCCDYCLFACLGSNLLVLDLQLATLEPPVTDRHFGITHASQLLADPAYSSLYRPPISDF